MQTVSSVTCPIPLGTYNSNIKLLPSRCRLRKTSRTTAKISKYHILESNKTGRDICHNILNTDIKLRRCNQNYNLDTVIPHLSPILKLFKNRHNRFNYFDKLKRIVESDQRNKIKKFKHQIDTRVLQSFFALLLNTIVPAELFGSLKNRKAVKRTISCLLKTVPKKMIIQSSLKRVKVTGAMLNIQPMIQKLDITTIKWLQFVDDSMTQWIIVLKLLHWFFAQYIIKILHKYVVLKVIGKRWIYITKDNWCKMLEEFVTEKVNNDILVPYTKLYKKYIGIYKFHPSSSGLRALFITNKENEEYFHMQVVLRFLQQLYITYLDEDGIPNIFHCRQQIANFQKSKSGNKLYCFTCDIQDAFGSIIQKKLYDIIVTYCNQLEKYLAVRKVIVTKPNKKKLITAKILSEKLKSMKLSKFASLSREKPKLFKTENITIRIFKLIFRQKVKFNNQLYSIKCGVPQGMMLSPILADIYYQYMCKEIFSEYMNSEHGILYRYVDDIIYITDSEYHARKFFEIIKSGIPSYNVKFNPNKIKTNLFVNEPIIITFLKKITIKL